ncbi:MAG: hypothetical protein JWN04_5536 [Myxococcaceae bacterium]|nr:hypothetical protein [Myxococcaceae bacterium]
MRQRVRGFTLIELMVALVAGAFAVSAVYYLSGVSARSFAEQMRVSETQMSLRSAMEQVRRDFSRAGYMAVPSSTLVPDCNGQTNANGIGNIAPRLMRAISVTRDGSLGNTDVTTLLAPVVNSTRADSVDLWGNYATPEVYLVDPVQTLNNQIFFQPTSEGFRRSFYDPVAGNGAATFNAARFLATFFPGRMVRIENEGRVFFRDITARDATLAGLTPGSIWPSVTVGNLPDCFVSSSWSSIAPVMHIRYDIESDATAAFGRLQSQSTATATAATVVPGARRTILVRTEWNDSGAAGAPVAVANSERLVLDYAVEFAVEAWTNTNTAVPATLPTFVLQRGNAVTAASATSQFFRSLLVTLTARSAEVDPRLPAVGPTRTFDHATLLNSPLMIFRVTDPLSALVLNARTRTLRSEIFLQNL